MTDAGLTETPRRDSVFDVKPLRGVVAPLLTLMTLLLAGCVGFPAERATTDAHATVPVAVGATDSPGLAVARAAAEIVGRRNLDFGDRRYRFDCSGVILAAHYLAGVPIDEPFARASGNGVARLHAVSQAAHHSHGIAQPHLSPGAIIFWDDTYDRNGDGRWNDPLTHAGIVIDVAADGTVTFVHHHYRLGIVTARMNVALPDDTTRNDPMRMRGQREPHRDRWLASHLFRGPGHAYLAALNARPGNGLH